MKYFLSKCLSLLCLKNTQKKPTEDLEIEFNLIAGPLKSESVFRMKSWKTQLLPREVGIGKLAVDQTG